MINFDLYKTFYYVAQCGSVTKAAEILCLSQPAVSQAMKQLEDQLGGKLFTRRSRGIALTETGGRQMYEIVSRAVNMIESAEDKFRESKAIATGTLRISATDVVVTHFLMRYIKKYHELYPNVTIVFEDNNTEQTLELIKQNKADIGLVNLPIYDREVIMTGQTGAIEDIFVGSAKYSKLFGHTIDLKTISEYPIMMLNNTTSTSKDILNFFDSMNVTIFPEFEIGSAELLIEMAKNGLGIACIPRRYVLEQLDSKELCEIRVSPSLPMRSLGIVINKDISTHSFAVREFIRILDDELYSM